MSKKNNSAKLTIEAGVKKSAKKPKMPIEDYLAKLEEQVEEGGEDGEGAGKIFKILKLYIAGYERTEIVKAGFNRTTVYRQVGEYEKLKSAPATHYQGFPVFETRVQRVMQRKNMTREEAVEFIMQKDLND
jgi:hypothetical protein